MAIYNISASITRPADTTTYASGDIIANSTTASLVVPMTFSLASVTQSGQIARVRVRRQNNSATGALYFVHLFTTLPTVSSGDNAAIGIATGSAGYLGGMLTAAAQVLADGVVSIGGYLPYIASGPVGPGIFFTDTGVLYGLLEVRGALVPTSAEVHTVTLEIVTY